MNPIPYLTAVAALVIAAAAFATPKPAPVLSAAASVDQRATAIFAGGCFWCMEPPFDKTEGVIETISGYIGGHVEDPTYQQVSAGETGHYEAVKVVYDPQVVSYEELLPIFWRNVDPLDDRGQFCDKGDQYLSAIFTLNAQQKQAAEQSLVQLRNSDTFAGNIATHILPAAKFYPAEQYHQDYYQKNPIRYKFYRSRCGRDTRLDQLWGQGQ